MKASEIPSQSVPSALTALVSRFLAGKRVMVTGVCGTVGKQLARQLLENFKVQQLAGLDHNESELAFLEEEWRGHSNCRFLLADVRDLAALTRELRGVDILFHAAGYKHVYVCERSPLEAIQTNVLGVQNVIQAAIDNKVERLVFTSSDKAVNPTNVMGTSKLMGERLVTAAAVGPNSGGHNFLSTRFGNVLGSRGSVIPIFRDQIRKGGPLTLTDPGMTRFVMSLREAVQLVIESVVLGRPGDVLITKMPTVRISDLAEVMVREFAPLCGRRPQDIEIKTIGSKPGEKLYEELMNEEETRRAQELERYFVVQPALTRARDQAPYHGLLNKEVGLAYNSKNETPLSQEELTAFLRRSELIEDPPEHAGR